MKIHVDMTNIKSYTDLQQSKKLAEILPAESADMEYMFLKTDYSRVSKVPFVKDCFEEPDCSYNLTPCWSLAALLEEIPSTIVNKEGEGMDLRIVKEYLQYYLRYDNMTNENCEVRTNIYDNLIDACYEMILKLNEKHLL